MPQDKGKNLLDAKGNKYDVLLHYVWYLWNWLQYIKKKENPMLSFSLPSCKNT